MSMDKNSKEFQAVASEPCPSCAKWPRVDCPVCDGTGKRAMHAALTKAMAEGT